MSRRMKLALFLIVVGTIVYFVISIPKIFPGGLGSGPVWPY